MDILTHGRSPQYPASHKSRRARPHGPAPRKGKTPAFSATSATSVTWSAPRPWSRRSEREQLAATSQAYPSSSIDPDARRVTSFDVSMLRTPDDPCQAIGPCRLVRYYGTYR